MEVIETPNVHQALPRGCNLVGLFGADSNSRNGKVRVLPRPLTTVYTSPKQRVLFWPERDANPFFHLFESLWMLAGRKDVAWMTWYNGTFGQFSDDGITFNGAYGARWRSHFGYDQLERIATTLKKDRYDRRQVLTMWDGRHDLGLASKDVPCNTQAYLQVNPMTDALDLFVTNRSNDLIWGSYGSNAVHFSMLLEYMAAKIERPVGRYYQVSMNTHIYERHFDLMKNLPIAQKLPPDPKNWKASLLKLNDPYAMGAVRPYDMVWPNEDPKNFEFDLVNFIEKVETPFKSSFFRHVVVPMNEAWNRFKKKEDPNRIDAALGAVGGCAALDWQKACVEWLERRR